MLFSCYLPNDPVVVFVHSDYDDNTPTNPWSRLCIKELFSCGEKNLALLSLKRKGPLKGWAIDERVTWRESDHSVTECVITGVNMLKGNAENFLSGPPVREAEGHIVLFPATTQESKNPHFVLWRDFVRFFLLEIPVLYCRQPTLKANRHQRADAGMLSIQLQRLLMLQHHGVRRTSYFSLAQSRHQWKV